MRHCVRVGGRAGEPPAGSPRAVGPVRGHMVRHQSQHRRLQEWASNCRFFSMASLVLPPLFQARRLPVGLAAAAAPQRQRAPSAPSEVDELLVRIPQSEHGPRRAVDSGTT
eukprot:9252904-Alexandrium_andersonii.AAC.1